MDKKRISRVHNGVSPRYAVVFFRRTCCVGRLGCSWSTTVIIIETVRPPIVRLRSRGSYSALLPHGYRMLAYYSTHGWQRRWWYRFGWVASKRTYLQPATAFPSPISTDDAPVQWFAKLSPRHIVSQPSCVLTVALYCKCTCICLSISHRPPPPSKCTISHRSQSVVVTPTILISHVRCVPATLYNIMSDTARIRPVHHSDWGNMNKINIDKNHLICTNPISSFFHFFVHIVLSR